MAAIYESGLRFEQLQGVLNAGAVEKLKNTKGSVRNNRGYFQVILSYQAPDADSPTKKRQVRLTHTTDKKYRANASEKAKRTIINDWRDKVMTDLSAVRGVEVSPEQTVKELVEQYIKRREDMPDTGKSKRGKGHISLTTATNWRYAVKLFERFPFYGLPMANATHQQLEDAMNELCKDYSGATIQTPFIVLRLTFSWVLGKGNENPCDDIDLPPKSYHPKGAATHATYKNILTEGQVKDLVEACAALIADEERESVAAGAMLMVTAGLRMEEATGLRWGDIDIKDKWVHITGAVNRWQDAEGKWHYERGKTKSKDSVRDVPLIPATLKALKQLRARRLEQLMKLTPEDGERISINDCYILGDLTGQLLNPNAWGKRWKKYATDNGITGAEGLTVTPHNLRDTFASRMAADGMAQSTLKALMGHSSYDITAKYYISSDADTNRKAITAHVGALGFTGTEG